MTRMTAGAFHDPALIATHPAFPAALSAIGAVLTDMHKASPRVVRNMASLQRWLITQSAFVLYLDRDTVDNQSGLTTTRLMDIVCRYSAASPNTASAHLAELMALKLIRAVPGHDSRRVKPLEISPEAQAAMEAWFAAHLQGLDSMDHGDRLLRLHANPSLFALAHPRAAKRLLADPAWHSPPAHVAVFTWSEQGSNLLHDLFARLPSSTVLDDKMVLGAISVAGLAEQYRISRSHVRRLLHAAEQCGAIGWTTLASKRALWLSQDLVQGHAHWQAVKFAALAEAFDWATSTSDAP